MGSCFRSSVEQQWRSTTDQLQEEEEMQPTISIPRKKKWDLRLILLGCGRIPEEEEEEWPENNRTWLLMEEGEDQKGKMGGVDCGEESGDNVVESHSMHSSFRFSFGSAMELEALNGNAAAAATVLLVNIEKTEEKAVDMQRMRMMSLERNISPVSASLVRFTYDEIRTATLDFSPGRVLGRGAHSCVYRGRIWLGRKAAVKCLNNEDKDCAKDFCRELMISSSLDHKNIVPLLGFCIDTEGLFLVYKFVSGGNLEQHIQGKKGKKCLPWSERYKVALGIAQAIGYLHYGTDRCVVHRDIKPSNILLSSTRTPKLCDFGLATWTSGASIPFLCKTVKGTFGYLAPEYFQHGKVSDKTDVYAFGVVLLELITGKRPIYSRQLPGDENLVLWARPLLYGKGGFSDLVDARLRHKSCNRKQVNWMVQTAAACISNDESSRPCIDQVIKMLRGEDNGFVCESLVSGEMNVVGQHDICSKSDMGGHLALAMMGINDNDECDQRRW